MWSFHVLACMSMCFTCIAHVAFKNLARHYLEIALIWLHTNVQESFFFCEPQLISRGWSPLLKNELWFLREPEQEGNRSTATTPQSSYSTVIPALHASVMLTLLELKRSQRAIAHFTWRGDFDLLVGRTSCQAPHKHLWGTIPLGKEGW